MNPKLFGILVLVSLSTKSQPFPPINLPPGNPFPDTPLVQTLSRPINPINLPDLPVLSNIHFAPYNGTQVEQQKKISPALDILLNFNLKICSTCESLKYFAIKVGNNNAATLSYLSVSPICIGSLSFFPPSGASGRPGSNQLFIATQLQDQTWLLQPGNCLGYYIKATSASTISVQNGLSSNARFWIQYHLNHVHLQSGTFTSSYWSGVSPLTQGPGAQSYMVQFWPSRAWP